MPEFLSWLPRATTGSTAIRRRATPPATTSRTSSRLRRPTIETGLPIGGGGRSSNYGASTIHIAAPGRHTFTVEDGGGYAYFGGTSAAAPIVAGVAALVWSVYPNWTVAQVRARLLDSVRTENEEGQLNLPEVTGGVIDAGAAVQ